MRLSIRGKRAVNVLRAIWVLVIFYYEFAVFLRAADRCDWPDNELSARSIDPQVLDSRSYPDRSALVTWLSQLFTDMNMRKSWYAIARKEPDAVVFLGDMMDNGRYNIDNEEYETYYRRFKSIFHLASQAPVYYIPGNHDIGLGDSELFSKNANARYVSHFGPLNHVAEVGNHTFLFIDAPSLAEEDRERHPTGITVDQWTAKRGGTLEFIREFANKSHRDRPLILFTHIPLARPNGASCGPNRERGTIHRGSGHGYQNTLGQQMTTYLLDTLEPSVAFSGDDHDYCEFVHETESQRTREVSVKSISMAMGISQPGYQLLSLSRLPGQPTFADRPCLLPNQLFIYLSIYVPLLVLSILYLAAAKLVRARYIEGGRGRQRGLSVSIEMGTLGGSLSGGTGRTGQSRNSFLMDVRDTAVYPLTLFVLIAWWSFLDTSGGARQDR
ncbi:Metallo-dependent phosphatase [Cylindrobasidium torrendii FP15055 ss-10]|uniref:Metallo-dependent phosphatase n=1 Tax=Cylindrobasidium torrendii FP15055 ss-10 TaxID=1314674 RepID=A0A0D7BDV1_9AGAR|nr:Metallo-dependent phosphatase [Cylindrobasidium torrendii FP15055 ss-10]